MPAALCVCLDGVLLVLLMVKRDLWWLNDKGEVGELK